MEKITNKTHPDIEWVLQKNNELNFQGEVFRILIGKINELVDEVEKLQIKTGMKLPKYKDGSNDIGSSLDLGN